MKQHKQLTDLSVYVSNFDGNSSDESKPFDDVGLIMNIYSEKLTKNRNGEFFI